MIDHPKRSEERWAVIFKTLGRNCKRCKRRYPAIVYDLHHPKGKASRKDVPSRIIRFAPDIKFLQHLKTWELLCANCHRLHHAEIGWHPARKFKLLNCITCKQQFKSKAPKVYNCSPKCQKEYGKLLCRNYMRRKRNVLQTNH